MENEEQNWYEHQPTLRDRFAMAVLSGYLANPLVREELNEHDCAGVYRVADLMMKERSK